jgi:LSD1 subclass zinc finger protein
VAPSVCPKCRALLSLPPAGEAGASTIRCAQCGSQYTLRRPGSATAAPRAALPRPAAGAASDIASGTATPLPAPGGGAPKRIGPYEISQVLGHGGMGIVYKGRDSQLDRWVAIKTLLPTLAADPESRERFKREARSAAPLSHPNLTQIYSISEEGDVPYFAMEFIEGEPLSQKLAREGKLKPVEAIRIARQVALGLQEGQRLQLIHRDIKPANLILTADGTLKITDFGLAKRAEGPGSPQLTTTGQAIGSPLYMSPEQARGAEVDHRSDIYSLGATFFHLLTGRPPFQGSSSMDILMKHLQQAPPSPRELNASISYPLAGLVMKMLRKRPEDRFPSYLALIEELDRVEAMERGAAGTMQQPIPVWMRERRSTSWASFAGILGLCVAGGLMVARGFRGYMDAEGGEHGEARRERLQEAAGAGRRGAENGAGEKTRPGLQVDLPAAGGGAELSARLRISGLSQVPAPPTGMRVQGQVVNEGQAPARGVSVQVRLFDGSGTLLRSQSVVPQRDSIAVRDSAPFEAYFDDVPQVERVEAEVTWTE